jgi:hypothetical protein
MGIFSRFRNLGWAAGMGLALVLGIPGCGGAGGGSTSSAPSATAPSITTQPASNTVAVGQTATFSVAATGNGTLSYQWRKGGASLAGQRICTDPSCELY